MALGSSGPVETKVSAATVAAVVSAFVLWVLRTFVFKGDVPPEVEALVTVAVVGACTFAAGWFARHTPRTDLDADMSGRHARPDQ
jgi:uncharacterized membrane-anchored protein